MLDGNDGLAPRPFLGLRHHSSFLEAVPAIRAAFMVGGTVAAVTALILQAANGDPESLRVNAVLGGLVWMVAGFGYLAHVRLARVITAPVGRTAELAFAIAGTCAAAGAGAAILLHGGWSAHLIP